MAWHERCRREVGTLCILRLGCDGGTRTGEKGIVLRAAPPASVRYRAVKYALYVVSCALFCFRAVVLSDIGSRCVRHLALLDMAHYIRYTLLYTQYFKAVHTFSLVCNEFKAVESEMAPVRG